MQNGTTSLNLATRQASLFRSLQPEINVKHPDFGYFLPPAPIGIRPVNGGYFNIAKSRIHNEVSVLRQDSLKQLPAYIAALNKFCSFVDLFDEYDLKSVVGTCTAMGFKKVTHSDLDEGAPLRVNRTHVLRPEIIDSIIRDWKVARGRINDSEIDVTMPSNTNLGWPFPFAPKGKLRPFVLGALALMVDTDKGLGLSLSDTYNRLRLRFGNPVILLGSRNQHTDKLIPFVDRSGCTWTKNFEPRTRAIYMGSKVGILANRYATKYLLRSAMKLPQHNQDRNFIRTTIDRWTRDKNLQLVAVDVSKFDKGHGGDYLVQFAKAAEKILGQPQLGRDLLTEVSLPLTVRYGRDLFITEDKIAPQLPSGVSFTTVAGLFFGDYICRLIGLTAGCALNRLGSNWDYLNWGDDMVLALPRSVQIDKLLATVQDDLQLKLEPEPVIRYLGFNYAGGSVSTAGGYSVARMIQKQYFPERTKFYPFSLIGYIARLTFLTKAEEFHRRFSSSSWDEKLYGPKFLFADRTKRLAQVLKEVNDSGDFDADALNFLLHGLEATEGAQLLEPLGVDFDFSQWIGHHYIDLRDPDAAMFAADPELTRLFKTSVQNIRKEGSSAMFNFASSVSTHFNLRFQGGMVF